MIKAKYYTSVWKWFSDKKCKDGWWFNTTYKQLCYLKNNKYVFYEDFNKKSTNKVFKISSDSINLFYHLGFNLDREFSEKEVEKLIKLNWLI